MGGKPIPYKNVCNNHNQQNNATPIGTNIFLVERDDAFIELLLNYLYKFFDFAARKLEPAWYEDVFGLKMKGK